MGGRKQKYNKIEPIISTLDLFLNGFIDVFLVISFLNGRRQMITQFQLPKAIFVIKITQIFIFFVKNCNFLVRIYFRLTQKVICVTQQVSQTQIKLYFITSYISKLQNEPIFEGINNIVDELLTKTYPYPPTKKTQLFLKIIKCHKTLLLLILQPFFVVTMNTYSSTIMLGVNLRYNIYPYSKF